uniref:Uncharacterized protein n=1 Tax=Avena sativa TaxID=4498 RepID=A0ACD5TV87_AVESA
MATTTTDSAAAAARRFALACGGFSQYVKAAGPVPMPMPIPANVPAVRAGAMQEQAGWPAERAQQLTIFYGGRVVVLDGCTPSRAAELILYATVAAPAPAPTLVEIPMARKASLQRFLSKRKDRSVSESEVGVAPPPPAKKGKTAASSWLALGR